MVASGVSYPNRIWSARRPVSGSIGICSVPAVPYGAGSAPPSSEGGYEASFRLTGVSLMRRYQRGVTFIGWVILMVPMALVFYAGVRLTPVYLNYMKVRHTL